VLSRAHEENSANRKAVDEFASSSLERLSLRLKNWVFADHSGFFSSLRVNGGCTAAIILRLRSSSSQ
jgi:hypothetical protein